MSGQPGPVMPLLGLDLQAYDRSGIVGGIPADRQVHSIRLLYETG